MPILMTKDISPFYFEDWNRGTDARWNSLPAPPDRYRTGHIKWGSDPKRGRGIQRAREAKRDHTNAVFFHEHVLPLIAHGLSPADWKALAGSIAFHADEYMARGGWTHHPKIMRWTHPDVDPRMHDICTRLEAGQPVPANIGLKPEALPAGYTLQGDQYVYAAPARQIQTDLFNP